MIICVDIFVHLDVDVAVVCCGLNIVSALLILAEDCDAKVLNKILQILSLHVFSMMMVTMRVVMRVP